MNRNSQSTERLEETAGGDPSVLAAAVAAVEPVHVFYPRHELHHRAVVGCQGLHVVELVDELKAVKNRSLVGVRLFGTRPSSLDSKQHNLY